MSTTLSYELGVSQREVERLRKQAETIGKEADQLFDRIGVKAGQRVVDVGCGPLGVLEQLAKRVGPTGVVFGVDVSPAFVEQARAIAKAGGYTNIEVIQGDARDTKLPHDSFDLVHARLLFINLPIPAVAEAAREMVNLAKPGGYIAVQEVEVASWLCEPPHPAWDKLLSTFMAVAGDGHAGRKLPAILRAAGLVDIQTEAYERFLPLGHLWRDLVLHFSDLTRVHAIQLGLTTAEELDAAKAALKAHLDDPNTSVLAPALIQSWGRKPATE